MFPCARPESTSLVIWLMVSDMTYNHEDRALCIWNYDAPRTFSTRTGSSATGRSLLSHHRWEGAHLRVRGGSRRGWW